MTTTECLCWSSRLHLCQSPAASGRLIPHYTGCRLALWPGTGQSSNNQKQQPRRTREGRQSKLRFNIRKYRSMDLNSSIRDRQALLVSKLSSNYTPLPLFLSQTCLHLAVFRRTQLILPSSSQARASCDTTSVCRGRVLSCLGFPPRQLGCALTALHYAFPPSPPVLSADGKVCVRGGAPRSASPHWRNGARSRKSKAEAPVSAPGLKGRDRGAKALTRRATAAVAACYPRF